MKNEPRESTQSRLSLVRVSRRQMLALTSAIALPAYLAGLNNSALTGSTMSQPSADTSDPSSAVHDLVIIGGGPAGLSAALMAGRGQLNTVIVDAGTPRNGVTAHSHGLFTRDGATPHELRAIGREQLEKYDTVRIIDGRVERMTHDEQTRFSVHLQGGGLLRARCAIVATGWCDRLADTGVPDVEEAYGTSIFPCPFCDGFEQRERRVGIFVGTGAGSMVGHYAAMVSVLARPELTVFTNGQAVPEDIAQTLRSQGNLVVDAPLTGLDVANGQLRAVRTDDGERYECDAGFLLGDYATPSVPFLEELGVPHEANFLGWSLPQTEDGATAIPGLWVAGDARLGFGGLAKASAHGYDCGAMVVREIAMARWHG